MFVAPGKKGPGARAIGGTENATNLFALRICIVQAFDNLIDLEIKSNCLKEMNNID